MPYVIRGQIGAHRLTSARIGQFTYLAETGDRFYIWNGAHKAAHFPSAEAGFLAASQCNGPWFNMPDAATLKSIEWNSNRDRILEGESESVGMSFDRH